VSRPIKLGVIGAGSATFSVGLVKDICLTRSLAGSLVTLMDVDRERVQIMHRFAERYAKELGAGIRFEWTLDRERALKDTDYVINTAQVGGHAQVEALRAWQEAQGYYRGMWLHRLLQVRMMVSVARDMERLCPDAWLIQASNPVFEGCTAMTRATGVKVCGICHGHFGYHEIARRLGLDVSKVTAQMVGFNHEIWLTHFEYEGTDAYHLIDDWVAQASEAFWASYRPSYGDNQMSRAAVELYKLTGLFPIGDTPRRGGWWYHTDLAAKKRWYGEPMGGFDSELGWREYLKNLEEDVRSIHSAVADTSSELTRIFKPRPTGEQHFPLIEALEGERTVELQVNVPNRGAIEGIPDDVVVEVPASCSVRGVQPLQIGRLPDVLMLTVLLPRLLEMERVISIALRPDERVLLGLVLDDHRTTSWEQAVAFVRELLARPEFADVAKEAGRPRHEFWTAQ
jgi:alpha-galactosidase